MPAKGKYNPEIVDLICEAIAETGSDKAGIEAGGISHDTFYKWISAPDKSEFAERVAESKRAYRRSRPKRMRELAVQRLSDYLHGDAAEIWEFEEIERDPAGNIKATREGIKRVTRPVPHWVIDRILGKSLPVLEAVQVLLNEGVATPAQAEIVERHINAMQAELRELAELEQRRAELEAIAAKTNSEANGHGSTDNPTE